MELIKIRPKNWDKGYFLAEIVIGKLSNGSTNKRYRVVKRITPSLLYADNFVKVTESMVGVEYTENEVTIIE